jgi:hypothetical protein
MELTENKNSDISEQALFDAVKNNDIDRAKYLLANNVPWDKKRGVIQVQAIFYNDDLINAIVASASIPFLSIKGVYTLFRGRKMIDGINPYHFEDEIRPCLVANFAYVPYPLHKLLSMSDKKICKLAYDGFKNFLKWTENNHDSSCFYLQRRTLSKYIHYALNIVYWADAKIIEKLPIIGNLKKKIVKKLLV